MHAPRQEIITAMANHLIVRIRDWAEDNLPDNHKLRVVHREHDNHVEATVSRLKKSAKWEVVTYVFPAAASNRMINMVMSTIITELASHA